MLNMRPIWPRLPVVLSASAEARRAAVAHRGRCPTLTSDPPLAMTPQIPTPARSAPDRWRVASLARKRLQAAVPSLSDRAALLRVQATLGLLNSVPNISTTVGDDDLRHELGRLALKALTAKTSADWR